MIPDGITPVAGWRVWQFDGTHIRSLNGVPWTRNEPLHALCSGNDYSALVKNFTVSMLKGPLFPVAPRTQYVGTGMSMSAPDPVAVPRSLRARYDAIRSRVTSRHSNRTPLPSVYDEDTGENFIPFGERSRLVLPKEVSDVPEDIGAPAEGCTCGIYAANDRAVAERYGQGGLGTYVLGRVALWGKVIIYDQGFRAEYAYPQAFYTDASFPGLSSYGVPILPYKSEAVSSPMPSPMPVYPLNPGSTQSLVQRFFLGRRA